MKPTEEQIKVLLEIYRRFQIDNTKGIKTFSQYVDIWWDFYWDRRNKK